MMNNTMRLPPTPVKFKQYHDFWSQGAIRQAPWRPRTVRQNGRSPGRVSKTAAWESKPAFSSRNPGIF